MSTTKLTEQKNKRIVVVGNWKIDNVEWVPVKGFAVPNNKTVRLLTGDVVIVKPSDKVGKVIFQFAKGAKFSFYLDKDVAEKIIKKSTLDEAVQLGPDGRRWEDYESVNETATSMTVDKKVEQIANAISRRGNYTTTTSYSDLPRDRDLIRVLKAYVEEHVRERAQAEQATTISELSALRQQAEEMVFDELSNEWVKIGSNKYTALYIPFDGTTRLYVNNTLIAIFDGRRAKKFREDLIDDAYQEFRRMRYLREAARKVVSDEDCRVCHGKGVYYEPRMRGYEVCTRCDAFDKKYAEQQKKKRKAKKKVVEQKDDILAEIRSLYYGITDNEGIVKKLQQAAAENVDLNGVSLTTEAALWKKIFDLISKSKLGKVL